MKRAKQWNRKHLFGTETAMGFIPHYRFGELDCPVRLTDQRDKQGRLFPEIRNGRLVHALPGGYTVVQE